MALEELIKSPIDLMKCIFGIVEMSFEAERRTILFRMFRLLLKVYGAVFVILKNGIFEK